MSEKYDQIVIGGGIIGFSIAYQLAKQGQRILLLDQGEFGAKASSHAAGMLGAHLEFGTDGPLRQLALNARAMMPKLVDELEQLTGIDIGYQQNGILQLAFTEWEMSLLQNKQQFLQEEDLEVTLLTSGEINQIEPEVSSHIRGGLWLPQDGQVIATAYLHALQVAVLKFGVKLLACTRFEKLKFKSGKLVGICTSRGEMMCTQVVFATGVGTAHLTSNIKLNLEVSPIKGEALLVKLHQHRVSRTLVSANGVYLCPKVDGTLYIGATSVAQTSCNCVTQSGIQMLWEGACEIMPQVKQATFLKSFAGFRPQTHDGLPYLGKHPNLDGVYIATGHYRHGILLAGVTGEWMAMKILQIPHKYESMEHAFALNREGKSCEFSLMETS